MMKILKKIIAFYSANRQFYIITFRRRLRRVFGGLFNFYITEKDTGSFINEILVTKDIIYYPLAKCANTSMKHVLINAYGNKGCLLKNYKTAEKKSNRSKYKFTVVRNPYDRLVSSFSYLGKRNSFREELNFYCPDKNPYQDFKTFIRVITKIPPEKRDEHYAPMSDMLILKNGSFIINFDKIIKIEEFAKDFEILKNKSVLLKNAKMLHMNQEKKEKTDYKSFYCIETFNLVKEYSKKDLEILDYKKEEKELYEYITQTKN